MATWDGSYHGPEDPNYFLYANPNASGTTTDNWNYFSGNGTNGFLQNGSNFYPQNEPMMYEQNAPGSYYQMDSHVPSVPSNLVPMGNTYQEHAVANAVGNAQIPSSSQCFYENNKTGKNSAAFHYENNYKKKSRGNKSNRHTYSQANNDNQLKIAEQSNLHATASEFVPNDAKVNEKKTKSNDPNCSGEFESKSSRSCDTVSVDGRNKHDRNYDYKKSKNYRKKESEDSYSQTGSGYQNYKGQNIRSYSTSRNDNYFNSKYYSDKSLGKIRKSSTPDARASSSSSNAYESSFVGINQEEQQSSSTNSNISKNEEITSDISNQESTSARNSMQNNKSRRFNVRSNEFWNTKYNSSTDQSQVPNKNTRKHSSNRNNRYENDYKEKRNSYQDYGTYRDSYNKENKSERFKEKENKDAAPESREKVVENWRQRSQNSAQSRGGKKWMQNKKHEAADDVSQRERLSDQLNRGQLECLVCCEYIKQTDYVWSCSNCYHVLHLKCVKKWAKSSQADNGWRCPACQNVTLVIPEEYLCFCGKTKTPEWNRRDTAHSCAEVCGRTLSKNNCIHKCTLLCHPGSCPPCITMVSKYCGCGKTSQILQCSSPTVLLCEAVCGKDLNCGKHTCEKKCHHGECGPCEKSMTQECYCGKNNRDVTCDADIPVTYSCGNACDKLLECGNHHCKILCHPDDCEPCSLTPDKITTCCCGQTLLTEKRDSCQDPVPTCDKTCSKRLRCGQPSNPHTCKVNCHEGDCPECELTTDVKCRCGNMDREIACKDLRTKADDARCEKRCTKKRSCGKHKCNQLCCIDIEHICPLRCSKTLSCGRHKCELTCHKGRCQPCWRRSFDELYCECGNAVILPPVPCGTRRPTCDKPCTREHACGHEVLHNCHSESTCPPCTVLTQRWCHGKHELRKAVPCHVSEISCGLPCNKPLSCGRHKCITICHSGCCEKPGQQCIQPCTTPRELCGHICAAPCHDDRCPDTPCKEMVKVTCQCGHRSTTRVCAENSREYQRIASSILASKMADMQLGHSVDLDEVFGQGAKKQNQLKTLECNDECKLIERNRRLALGLQIVNPDLSGKLMPRYSTFMKQWAKKDPRFCQMVHDKLTELVQLAKTSKQKSRSYSFDSMNREKRRFVHESCEHFGCESQAYDQEPKRNVVATAVKDKCWLPSYSLLEVVQRENGQRKVPGPMLNTSKGTSSVKTVLSLPVKQSLKTVATPSISKSPEPEIDYFDYQG